MNSTTSEKSSSRAQENKDGSSENMAASARSSRSSNSDHHETNKVASSKSSFENANNNSANSNNITNQHRSLETKPASTEHSTKSSDAEERNSDSPSKAQEAASEKTSSENEKSEAKESHNTHLIPKHPPQCSEAAAKKNAVNNNGKNQPSAIPGTKLSDAKTSNSKNSTGQGSNNSRSDSIDSNSTGTVKRHTGGDCRWEAVQLANAREAPLGLSHFRLLKRLGYGDIGSVYLVELRGTGAFFAMKVMDRASLVSRNKLLRAQTEREILGLLDHPFLPTLYCYFETEKFYCLVMEYCSGGNLHSLRQKQPSKYFTEQAARFYASEVLLALEYLHMLGVIYRDLKPENVLVREEGHIMLSDFDLSLRCSVSPTLVNSQSTNSLILEGDQAVQSCIQPSSFFPRILPKRSRKSKSDFGVGSSSLPELLAEPTTVRSMSFVGTHEYLAPEIIKGEGHGSAVDWWTFGIFLYELLHGTTPFKGSGNKATLHNVVGQPLRFPEMPNVSNNARDLIRGLLVKDPQKRIAYRRGATEIKQHPFFEGVNWALVRSASPPHVPEPVDFSQFAVKEKKQDNEVTGGNKAVSTDSVAGGSKGVSTDSSHLDFEYF